MARLSQDDWCCAALQRVFREDFYRQVVRGLDELQWTEARQSFYCQREVNLRGIPYYDSLFYGPARESIAGQVSQFFGVDLAPDFDVAAHKMIAGDYIGVHTDENSHGETHRMTVTLNDRWAIEEGGILLALDGGALSSIRDAWLPTANKGFLFEISPRSFHAVTPIVGERARYSLIVTFKQAAAHFARNQARWLPFPLASDLRGAASTASHMEIDPALFESPFQFVEFDSAASLASGLGSPLHNAPAGWSYSHGHSRNVDLDGNQPKGSDEQRVEAVSKLQRLPPVIVVRRTDGSCVLVDGSHRLSLAVDRGWSIGVAFFDQRSTA